MQYIVVYKFRVWCTLLKKDLFKARGNALELYYRLSQQPINPEEMPFKVEG